MRTAPTIVYLASSMKRSFELQRETASEASFRKARYALGEPQQDSLLRGGVWNNPLKTSLFLAALVAGCTSDTTPAPDCVPDEATYDAEVRAVIEDRCGTCHGESPMFGAPFSLLDYAPLVAGEEGTRIVDRMHMQLEAGTMPPTGFTQPPAEDRDLIASWASCGAVRIMDEGSNATRPPFVSPEEPPPGLETIDVTADAIAVGPDVLDRYNEFFFTNLVDEDVFIRRFEAVVDEARVVHHLTLQRGDAEDEDAGEMKYLYAWAPGTGDFQFPSGGVRLRPGDVLRLEIHYNNGSRAEGVRDSSGVRLHIGAVEGDEYVMADPGPGALGFSIPARSEETVEATCEVHSPVRMLATMPHMHEIGDTFELEHTPAGGTSEMSLALRSWDFETQLFYDVPLDLEVGDQLTVRCGFVNPSDGTVRAGLRTQDEMCFAFSYVTPPDADFCGAPGGGGGMPELVYEPGVCAGEELEAPRVVGAAVGEDESPVFDAEGTLPEGRFVGGEMIIVTPNPAVLGVATISFAGTVGRGDEVDLDVGLHFIAPTPDLRDGVQEDISVAGTLDATDGPSTLTTTCPTTGDALPFTFGTVEGRPAVRFELDGEGVPLVLWLFFDGV